MFTKARTRIRARNPIQRKHDAQEQLSHSPTYSRNPNNSINAETLQGRLGNQGTQALFSGSGENQTGLPNRLKSGLEHLSGEDLSAVRVHRNSSMPSKFDALAYTRDKNIYLAPGQEQHLPHEGWHVVQQIHGNVKPTAHEEGVSINNDAALEREADVMGAKATQMNRLEEQTSGVIRGDTIQQQSSSIGSPVIQLQRGQRSELEGNREEFNQAMEMYHRGRYRRAFSIFERLQRRRSVSSHRSEILWNMAMCHLHLRRFRQAAVLFEDYISIASGVNEREAAQQRLLEARRGMAGRATEGNLEENEREQVQTLFDRATSRFRRGHFRRARNLFQQLLGIPGLSTGIRRDTVFNLGLSNLRLRHFLVAERNFEMYLQMPGANQAIGEDMLNAARNRVRTVEELPREEATVEQARSRFQDGVRYYAQRQWGMALAQFLRAIRNPATSERHREIRWNIAMCRLRLRRFRGAERDFLRYMNLPGADTQAAREKLDLARRHVADID